MTEARAGSEVGKILNVGDKYWVEYVGEKSAYIRTAADEVVILSNKLFTPYSIVFGDTWETVREKLAARPRIVYSESFLELGDVFTVRVKSGEDSPKITFKGNPNKNSLKHAYHTYLIISSVSGLDGFGESLRRVGMCEPEDVLNSLGDFVGKGPGLTPAGDDFVSGVLLSFRLLGLEVDAGELLQKTRINSRWPSWKMMEHAYHGCTFSPIYNLCKEIIMGGECVEHVLEAVQIGGSTGLATLAGLLESLRIFSK